MLYGTLKSFSVHQKYAVILILLIQNKCFDFKLCETENSTTQDKSEIIQWHSNVENEIVFSSPLCLDEKNQILSRTCINGQWEPSSIKNCRKLVKIENKFCPPYLLENRFCILITELVPFKELCQIKDHYMKMHSYNTPKIINNTIWAPIKRNIDYGPFQYVFWGDDYGKKFTNFSVTFTLEQLLQKDCVIYNVENNSFLPDSCNNYHNHICWFPKKLENVLCPKNCTFVGDGTESCYCKIKNEKCEQYARVRNPFDEQVLRNLVSKDEECSLGNTPRLFKEYQYSITKSNLIYTSKPLNCSLCRRKSLQLKADMVLEFQAETKKLHLLVYSPENLDKSEGKYKIYCSTDASDKVNKSVKTELVYTSAENSKDRRLDVFKIKLEKYMGRYVCESRLLGTIITSNIIVAYKKRKGHEYALRMIIVGVCKRVSCDKTILQNYARIIDDNLEDVFKYLDSKIRVMQIFNFTSTSIDVLFHISTNKRNRNVFQEYNKLKDKLQKLPNYYQIKYFKSSEYCFTDYTSYNGLNLTWPVSELDESVTAEEICSDNMPLFRVCQGSFLYGTSWSEIQGNCIKNFTLPLPTDNLRNISKLKLTTAIIEEVTKIIQNRKDLSILDIYYLEKILQKIRELNSTTLYVNQSLQIINAMQNLGKEQIRNAQTFLNISDRLLDDIEAVLSNINYNNQTTYITQDNVMVFITNPFITNINGLVLRKNNSFYFENINRNTTFENLKFDKTFELAVRIPESILEDIIKKFDNVTQANIIITVYFTNKMFPNQKSRSVGKIVSVNVNSYGNYLPGSIPILFRSSENKKNAFCGFWDYGKRTKRKKGSWSDIGGNYLGTLNRTNDVHICSFQHLTHFALLIMEPGTVFDDANIVYPSGPNNFWLNVITCVGSILTFLGTIGIFVTASVFEEWRKRQGTRILMHIAVAIVLETIGLQFIELKDSFSSNISCVFGGIVLHYLVLSKFSWILIYAFLQYLRFVKVFGPLPSKLVLKSAVFGWGFPLIPVSVVVVTDLNSYTSEDYHFCYPRGNSLYLGVILPISLVVFTNLGVFCLVMYQVSNKKIESHGKDSHKQQLKLASLLFFMLGLPYLVALPINFVETYWLKMICVYIFCIAASLQGFILFLFYVVFNKETRMKWYRIFIFKQKC